MTKDSLENLEEILNKVENFSPPTNIPVELEKQVREGEEQDALVDELQRKSSENRELSVENRSLKQSLEDERFQDETDHWKDIYELRKEYIPKLFLMVVCWLIFVGMCIFAVGAGIFRLSDAVTIALVTTTTATVIGIFLIVAKWLFPPPRA